MEFELGCECGEEIAGFTRSDGNEADFIIECEDCSAVYTVSVTRIRPGD